MTDPDGRERRATLYALTAVFFWSTVATVFKLSLRVLSPLQLLLGSSITAALALLVILAASGRLAELRHISRRNLAVSAGLGLLNPFIYYLILFRAYDILPAQQAQPLNMTWGVILALLAVPLLGQRLSLRSLGALLLALAGVVVISTEGRLGTLEIQHPLGIALVLSSAFLWALYWIANTRDRLDPVIRLFLNFSAGAAFTTIWWLIRGAPLPAGITALAGAVYVGLFEMGITFFLWLRAMRLTRSAARIGILVYIAPFVSLVFIHFILGEHILPASFIGLVMIVAGILWQRRDNT